MKIAVLTPNKPFWGARIVQIPFLFALRRAHPEAEIGVWSRVGATAEFLGWGLADEHATYSGSGPAWAAGLRRWKPDLVFNLRRKSTACCLAAASAGGKRAGYDEGFLARLLDERVAYDAGIYLSARYLALVERGVRDGRDERSIPLFREWAKLHAGARAAEPRVVLIPGAGEPAKRWPIARFVELARWIEGQGGGPIAMILGPAEKEERSAIAGEARIDVIDTPTLPDLLSLVEAAPLIVASDGGASHLAQLAGRRFLGIYRARWGTPADWFLDKANSDLVVSAAAAWQDAPVERVAAKIEKLLDTPDSSTTIVRYSRGAA